MITQTNLVLHRTSKKSILLDVYNPSNRFETCPIIIFCHGYKGFKDWGAWSLMAKRFVKAGFNVVKFNFSHNGSTIEQPIDFPDLEAFGQNNYSTELDDLKDVVNWVAHNLSASNSLKQEIYLIGHSRGGGIVTIYAEEDSRIQKVVTLAGVSDFKSRFVKGEQLKAWKQRGVMYITNGRTKQQMPHYYQFYEDFIENVDRLTIKRAVSQLKIPLLIIHGNQDTSVLPEEALKLHQWQPNSQLLFIKEADHVFNTRHPWILPDISAELLTAVETMINFFNRIQDI
ncbi:MAG: alpha/beta fold hydrolase [Winogradskyella sp.]|nr:alpha/beta fold hydrolase [Winogradskyella sp.]